MRIASNMRVKSRGRHERWTKLSVRILVADDNDFWRKQLREILTQIADAMIFEAANGYEAVRRALWVHPDVAILDYSMPVLDGLGAARELKRLTPDLPILIITADKTSFLETAALRVGALAVFSKAECLELPEFLEQTVLARRVA